MVQGQVFLKGGGGGGWHFPYLIFSSTAVMTENGTFQQKSITQYRKTFITHPKHMVFCENEKVLKAQDLVLFLKKKMFFYLGVAHGDPIFAQVGPKKINFRGFSKIFSELLGSN